MPVRKYIRAYGQSIPLDYTGVKRCLPTGAFHPPASPLFHRKIESATHRWVQDNLSFNQ